MNKLTIKLFGFSIFEVLYESSSRRSTDKKEFFKHMNEGMKEEEDIYPPIGTDCFQFDDCVNPDHDKRCPPESKL